MLYEHLTGPQLHLFTGKCSHGGLADLTSQIEPTGGINKDDLKSSHGFLHATATDVAKAATRQLLEDVRSFAGDRTFLRYQECTTLYNSV